MINEDSFRRNIIMMGASPRDADCLRIQEAKGLVMNR